MTRALAFSLLTALACTKPHASAVLRNASWIDLTHDFSSSTIYWPTAKPFSLEVVSAQQTPGGYYYAANNFSAAEHGGTHLDAPVHFAEGKWTSDQIPLERLVGEAVVVDVQPEAERTADYRVDRTVMEAWERNHGRIPDGAMVLFRTGWGRRWHDRAAYLGTTLTGAAAVPELHFPGIDSTAAAWLVDRKVRAVGIDTPSIDYGQSSDYLAHRVLFAANIPAFENVANLDRLPAVGSFIVALPMKIKGGSGGPLRIVAVLPP
ncbi:MAG TPA: cyclase family protein [Gemmatimonadales bacterium]|nr:cyclase family protein [Gemmatimonadales bacterium]